MKHWWRRSAYTVSAWVLLLFLFLLLLFSTLLWFYWVNSCLRACRTIIIVIIIDEGSRRLTIILEHLFNCCYFVHLPHTVSTERLSNSNTIFLFHPMGFPHLYSIMHNNNNIQCEPNNWKWFGKVFAIQMRAPTILSRTAIFLLMHLLHSALNPIHFFLSAFLLYSIYVNAWIQSFCFAFYNDWDNLIRAYASE